MKKTNLIVILTIITILLSCGKKAITIHPELTGTWTGSDSGKSYELIISPNSTSSSFTISSSLMSYSKYTGTARIKDDYLKIGFFKKFKIDEYPSANNNYGMQCKIDGVVLQKIN